MGIREDLNRVGERMAHSAILHRYVDHFDHINILRSITKLVDGIVDICGMQPYQYRDIGLGCCVVSNPVLIFVDNQHKETFAKWLDASCNDRFLPASTNPGHFLLSGPHKVHSGGDPGGSGGSKDPPLS